MPALMRDALELRYQDKACWNQLAMRTQFMTFADLDEGHAA